MGHIKDIAIDMERTGLNIEMYIKVSGIKVSKLQEILKLSCPQPIYRWMKGKMLPTVDHFYIMSKLFGVHMEDLIVAKEDYMTPTVEYLIGDSLIEKNVLPSEKETKLRLYSYHKKDQELSKEKR